MYWILIIAITGLPATQIPFATSQACIDAYPTIAKTYLLAGNRSGINGVCVNTQTGKIALPDKRYGVKAYTSEPYSNNPDVFK